MQIPVLFYGYSIYIRETGEIIYSTINIGGYIKAQIFNSDLTQKGGAINDTKGFHVYGFLLYIQKN